LSAFNVKLNEISNQEHFPQMLWGTLQELYEAIDPTTQINGEAAGRFYELERKLETGGETSSSTMRCGLKS
jgi:hypothetical protein